MHEPSTSHPQVAPGVWRITTPMPYRPRSVHAYLVDLDGGWMLVDGGLATEEAWAALSRGVGEIAGGWTGIGLHVVTHMHLDHIGLAPRVGEACGAELAMGELDAQRAAHAAAEPEEEAEYRRELLRRCGAPAPEVERLVGGAAAAPRAAFRAATRELPSGTAPLAGAPGWLSVWTPGHTAGHTSLFRVSDRLLLAGDAILPRITPTIGVNRQRADPVGDYLETLPTLRALSPALAACGHGEPIHEPQERIVELRDAARGETVRVRASLSPEPRSVAAIVDHLYPDREMPAGTRMLALRETLAHLEHLLARGEIERMRDGDAELFRVRRGA